MTAATHRGSCLCGTVHYVVEGDFEWMTHCHCSMCRKAHGAAFATYATVRTECLRIEQGEHALKHLNSSATVIRSFCSNCGSPLLWRDDSREPGMIAFALGGLDTELAPGEQRHIFAGSKASWYLIEDHWPQSV